MRYRIQILVLQERAQTTSDARRASSRKLNRFGCGLRRQILRHLAAASEVSANTNGVQLLGLTVSDPPTQSELQAVANKIDELITAMRR